jgi:hypothetical protein
MRARDESILVVEVERFEPHSLTLAPAAPAQASA